MESFPILRFGPSLSAFPFMLWQRFSMLTSLDCRRASLALWVNATFTMCKSLLPCALTHPHTIMFAGFWTACWEHPGWSLSSLAWMLQHPWFPKRVGHTTAQFTSVHLKWAQLHFPDLIFMSLLVSYSFNLYISYIVFLRRSGPRAVIFLYRITSVLMQSHLMTWKQLFSLGDFSRLLTYSNDIIHCIWWNLHNFMLQSIIFT